MTDHVEQAESATRAAQAALDQMNPDPAELAILAASHWLGAIHEVLRQAFNEDDARAWHDGYGAGRDDEAQALPLRHLPTTEQDGEPTVEQPRPDLDRHAREAALLRDDR